MTEKQKQAAINILDILFQITKEDCSDASPDYAQGYYHGAVTGLSAIGYEFVCGKDGKHYLLNEVQKCEEKDNE